MIYHGSASQSRQTHKQIEMMRFLDERFELSLMILEQPDYIESLKKSAQPFNNVKFLPPVGTNEIAAFTNQFEVGIYSLPPTNPPLAFPNRPSRGRRPGAPVRLHPPLSCTACPGRALPHCALLGAAAAGGRGGGAKMPDTVGEPSG